MLPTLSRLSVRTGPAPRFRHRRSLRYLRISPLHLRFQAPLPASRPAVYQAVPWLSQGISQGTCQPAYTRFKPSDSEQRLGPPSYRGCWHGVSRPFRLLLNFPGYSPELLAYRLLRFTSRRTSSRTRRRSVRLAPIAEYSLLQPPVGVRAVSQSRCRRPTSQPCYPSSPWWAVTSPTS